MLVEDISHRERGVVAVKPDSIRFASGCFACSEPEASAVQVSFTKTLILVLFGGIESTTLVVPLCQAHQNHYEKRMRTISRFQMACGAAALLFFGLLFWMFEHPSLEAYQPVPATLGVVAVVAAYFSIGFRSTALPVRFRGSSHGRTPFSSERYGAYVFTFEDRLSGKRFYDANDDRV